MTDRTPTINLGRLAELIARNAQRSFGTYVKPVKKGTPMDGWRTQDPYQFDGWEIGYIIPGGGGAADVGETIADAVEGWIAQLDYAAGSETSGE